MYFFFLPPDVWSTNPEEEEQLCSGPRFYTGKPRDISVFFTPDPSFPALRATVQAYRSQGGSEENGSLSKADFPRDCVPSHELLQRWVEDQIQTEQRSDFQYAAQSFVLAYSAEGWGLPKVRPKRPPPVTLSLLELTRVCSMTLSEKSTE